MAAPTDAAIHGAHDPDVERTKQYVVVAAVLAVFTAIEVSTYWMTSVDTRILTVGLVILMATKFAVVTAFFMHLKFDKRFLTFAFYSSLLLAVCVYLAILTAFRFWAPSDHVVSQGLISLLG